MVGGIEDLFPRLRGTGYQVTSPSNDFYNCIAWAVGDTQSWWWPDVDGNGFWPEGVSRSEQLSAFQEVFLSLGYAICSGEQLEAGFEKIALFADPQGFPLHAARQLSRGRWTSKLGELEDIEHELGDLEGATYGSVALIMRRPRAAEAAGKS